MPVFPCITYAHARRFEPPVPTPKLHAIDNLPTSPHRPPQNPCRLESVIGPFSSTLPQGEDCLSLSVFTPSLSDAKPVLVWIHGGAFLTGSAHEPQYNPQVLADAGNMVVVNISYRLGALGFLYHPRLGIQNLGLLDQVCALRWVHDNIHLFGGDPARVTLMGQSAGAYSILCHIATLRHPLFSQAIIASAPFFAPRPAQLSRAAKLFFDSLPGAQQASIEQILQAQQAALCQSHLPMPFCPVVPNPFRPRTIVPGLRAVMLWHQHDDALPFVPYSWISPLVTQLVFRCPMLHYARHLDTLGVHTSTHRLSWRHHEPPFGATHCMELPLLFGNWDLWQDTPFMQGVTLPEYQQQAHVLQQLVSRFVNQQ